MIFDCGLTFEQRHEAKKEWRRWFAWYPVRLPAGECVWFELIERQGEYKPTGPMWSGEWHYTYREIH